MKSAASRAKSACARATIAIRMLKSRKKLSRRFDDCFEMGDGGEVVREIRRRSREDPLLVEILNQFGLGYWLKPDKFDEKLRQPNLMGF